MLIIGLAVSAKVIRSRLQITAIQIYTRYSNIISCTAYFPHSFPATLKTDNVTSMVTVTVVLP